MSGLSSSDSSSLSSVPTHVTHLYVAANTEARLRTYRPDGKDDDTVAFLKAFVELLPPHGASNIMDDIVQCESDEKLRQLAGNLRTALLVPSK